MSQRRPYIRAIVCAVGSRKLVMSGHILRKNHRLIAFTITRMNRGKRSEHAVKVDGVLHHFLFPIEITAGYALLQAVTRFAYKSTVHTLKTQVFDFTDTV